MSLLYYPLATVKRAWAKMKISSVLLRAAEVSPKLTGRVVWIWVKLSLIFAPKTAFTDSHWLLQQLAAACRCRIPTKAKLGNGMSIIVPWNDSVGEGVRAG